MYTQIDFNEKLIKKLTEVYVLVADDLKPSESDPFFYDGNFNMLVFKTDCDAQEYANAHKLKAWTVQIPLTNVLGT